MHYFANRRRPFQPAAVTRIDPRSPPNGRRRATTCCVTHRTKLGQEKGRKSIQLDTMTVADF